MKFPNHHQHPEGDVIHVEMAGWRSPSVPTERQTVVFGGANPIIRLRRLVKTMWVDVPLFYP